MSQPELRISDQERETAVTALGEHYVAGRLTKEEYDDRSAVAAKARTNSDLAPLFVDLPPLHQSGRAPAPRPSSTTPAWPSPQSRRRSGFRVPVLPLVLIVVGIAMLTEGWAIPLLVLGALLWLKLGIGRRFTRGPESHHGGGARSSSGGRQRRGC